ncbi:ankyrin repeat-containing domain protein [Ustulina deusta]|nr:ankyrin repeat-containing domain protein [Ustulina deusta]
MSSNDWERYKAIILYLYLIEKTPLNQVICHMEQEHNFSKKNSQYEYQFKKWGVKKYAKQKDWKNLRHQLEKRAGKQSEITMFGIPLSPRRVHKRIQRYTSIPTASEFGKRSRSPESLGGTIVRAQTPIIIESISWPPLPWFHFKNSILLPNSLRDPSALLRTLFAAFGSKPTAFQDQGESPFNSLYEVFRNPVDLRKTMFHLTNTIPDDDINGQQGTNTLAQEDSSLSITTEALKLIFFRLSNKMLRWSEGRAHDQFVLHLVEAVSRTNPEMLSRILLDDCVTAKAIREAVYGSAIREKHYTIVSRLLESKSVDPNFLETASSTSRLILERGSLRLNYIICCSVWSGMIEAALTRDTRLAKMLLRAGASLGDNYPSILEIACASSENSDSSMEFIRLLDEHGVINNYSALCSCPCPGSKLISPIAMSIARSNNCVAKFLIEKFLIEKEASVSLPQYSERGRCRCCAGWFCGGELDDYRTGYMPLHLAIVTGNEEIIGRLLLPVMSHPPRVSVRVIHEAFLFSCFAGDANTASKLLARHPSVLASTVRKGITPLVATAWNTENTTIAETLLRLGADIGPTRNDGLSTTRLLAPIHAAAFYGNTDLVRELLRRGADCNVRWVDDDDVGPMELPDSCESALQFALEGGRIETARLLMPHSRLLGRELMQAIALDDDALISGLISMGANVMWTDKSGKTVLEVAVETGNGALISRYFDSGGTYRSQALRVAIEAAIESKDHSIVRLLVNHRHAREIDSPEASSLVFAIWKRAWDLVSLLLHDSFIPGPAGSERYRIWGGRANNPQTPLCAALLSENQSVIEEMIKRGYALRCKDIWQLMKADGESIRQTFWDRFPLETMDLSFHWTLLLHAIESGNTQKVREYIKIIDCLDFPCQSDGLLRYDVRWGPLALATIKGSTEIVRLLLDAGAGVDVIDSTSPGGEAALQYAARRGHLHLVQLLLDRGARVDPPAHLEVGATALQYSAIEGHLKIAQLLLSRGADINAPPAKWYGRTALEGASENGRLDMVQFLLKMGAQIHGQMRIHYVRSVGFAKQKLHYAIANYLMQYGSWGCRDQILDDEPGYLLRNAYFQYEEVIDDRRVQRKKYYMDNGYRSVELSDFSEFSDSSDECEEDECNEGDSGELSRASYDTDCIPQAWWDNMGLTVAEPSGLNTIGTHAMVYGSASSQMSTTQRVIEVDDVVEDGDAALFDVGSNVAPFEVDFNLAPFDVNDNVASREPADDGAGNQLELWEPRSNLREGLYECGMNNGAPEINFAAGRGVAPNEAEIEWEGPFLGVSEAEAEWEGPFSRFVGFDDIDER